MSDSIARKFARDTAQSFADLGASPNIAAMAGQVAAKSLAAGFTTAIDYVVAHQEAMTASTDPRFDAPVMTTVRAATEKTLSVLLESLRELASEELGVEEPS